jgi:hypothetical protein
MKHAAIINAETGHITSKIIGGLEDMQAAVDGLIESVGHPFEDEFSIFVNEEGKFVEGHFYNVMATKMFGQWITTHGDYFAGDVLVMGPVDNHGETLGLRAWQIDKLMDMRRAALR